MRKILKSLWFWEAPSNCWAIWWRGFTPCSWYKIWWI